MPFTVLIDDNFHYMDESARYQLGVFDTLDDARDAARLVVDEYLRSAYEPGMDSDTLFASYTAFGEDPFIVPTDQPAAGVLFSARDYARDQCASMCSQVEISPEYLVDRPRPLKGGTTD